MFHVTIRDAGGDVIRAVAFDAASVVIGRAEACDLTLDDDSLSRKHLRLWDRDGHCQVEDLNSANGVLKDGEKLQGVQPVEGALTLSAGVYTLTIQGPDLYEKSFPYFLRSLGKTVSEEVLPLRIGQNLIGRDEGCEITLAGDLVSRKHATVTVAEDGAVQVADLESANGIQVNGQDHERIDLRHGDRLQVGEHELLFLVTATQIRVLYPDGDIPDELRWSQGHAQLGSPRREERRHAFYGLVGLSVAALIVAIVAAVIAAVGTLDVAPAKTPSTEVNNTETSRKRTRVRKIGPTRSSPSRMTNAALVDYMKKRTVYVMRKDGLNYVTGTGFFIGPSLVLTNRHVVGTESLATVTNEAISKETKGGFATATVKHLSSGRWPCTGYCRDYAVLELLDYRSDATIELTQRVMELDEVVATGYPGAVVDYHVASKKQASPPAVSTQGVVNAILNDGMIINHDARVMHGNSGGPLVDRCGRVVGINTFVGGTNQRADFALGSVDIVKFLTEVGITALTNEDRCRSE